MSAYGWQKKLHPGDEVTWVDPDEGKCSRTGTISQISFKPDDAASIMFTDGHELECFLHELR